MCLIYLVICSDAILVNMMTLCAKNLKLFDVSVKFEITELDILSTIFKLFTYNFFPHEIVNNFQEGHQQTDFSV